MARRSYRNNNDEFDPWSAALGLAILIVAYFGLIYATNKHEFWREIDTYVVPGAILLAVLGVVAVYFALKHSKANDVRVATAQKQINPTELNNFIDRYGKSKNKEAWKYRGYAIDQKDLSDYLERLQQNNIALKSTEELTTALEQFIETRDKQLMNESLSSTKTHRFADLGKNGNDFELLVTRLYNAMGYVSEQIGGHGDQGGDVIANRNGERLLIQAKFYTNSVGNAAVQQAVAACKYYDCTKAVVVTTATFTAEAEALATANHVELIDGNLLQQKLQEHLHETWS